MKVINSVPWAGLDFSYLPGQAIELPDEVAVARINLGLATEFKAKKLSKLFTPEPADVVQESEKGD